MAGVDIGGGRPQRKQRLRRPKRRIGIRIDMTPMVDIAFLLLIFYMVTTIFAQPQAMEINLPKDEKKDIEIAESNLLILRVSETGKLYWNFGTKTPEELPFAELRKWLLDWNRSKPKLNTLIKIHQKAKYHNLVDIIDEIQVSEQILKEANPAFSYRFAIAPWDDNDDKQIAKATGGGA